MADDSLWKKRFVIFMAARLVGLLTFLAGVAIAFSVLRPGGWPQLGAVLIIIGIIDTVFSPKLLKRHWERVDREADSGT